MIIMYRKIKNIALIKNNDDILQFNSFKNIT